LKADPFKEMNCIIGQIWLDGLKPNGIVRKGANHETRAMSGIGEESRKRG
jgi:hypothetical protein